MENKFIILFLFLCSQGLTFGQANDWLIKGENLNKESQYKQSSEVFNKAYLFYKEKGNKKGTVRSALGLGYANVNLHKIPESLKFYREAYNLAKNNNWLEEEREAADALSSMLYLTGQPQEAISYAVRCVELGLVLKDQKFYSTKLMELGYLYFQMGALDSADLFLHKALKVKQEINDESGAVIVQNYLGEFYKSIGDYEKAQDLNFLNLNYWIEQKDSVKLITTYFNISSIFFEMEDFEKSETYALESLKLAVELNLVFYRSFGIKRLAEISSEKGDTDSALQQYDKLIKIYEITDHKTRMADALLKVTSIYLDRSELKEATSYLERAIPYVAQTEDLKTKIKLKLVQSKILNKQGKHENAISIALSAFEMASKTGRQSEKAEASLLISSAYSSVDNSEDALKWHRIYTLLKDSLSEENQQNSIHELETKYRVSQKQEEIQKLSTENELSSLRLESASRNQVLLIGGISLLALIAALSYFFYRTKKRDNALLEEKNNIINLALDEKELLVQEIHHRVKNNLQTISSLLNMQSLSMDDSAGLAALKTGEARIKSMALIHESLFKTESGINLQANEYIKKLASNLFDTYNIDPERIILNLETEKVDLDLDRMIALGLILNELISNSIKHAFCENEHGIINVKLTKINNRINLQVSDNGSGLADDYADRNSLGFQIIRDFVKKLKGELTVNNSSGCNINISIPD